jgi:inositol oxygenase
MAVPLVHGIEGVLKDESLFRNFEDSPLDALVTRTYMLNHTFQTLEWSLSQRQQHLALDKGEMTVWEVFQKLEYLVDESDPDNDRPQIIHAYQTAEALRAVYPDQDWLHLVGLIHDLGKMLSLPEFGGAPQWAVVGDTFPLGCAFSHKICKSQYFAENPDNKNLLLNTEYGIYRPGCGLANVVMSWGHDEYMYQVLLANKCKIPQIGLNIIRFHSFFSWHRDGEYRHLMNEDDYETLKWTQRFSAADLYSKGTRPITDKEVEEELEPYYKGLVEKYFPLTVCRW